MKLTDHQSDFVHHIVYDGVSGSEAARRAGYSPVSARQTASQLLSNQAIQQEIRTLQFKLLGGQLASKALRTLEKIIDDDTAPYGARVDACKTILDRAGVVTTKSDLNDLRPKSVDEMTRIELEQFIRDYEKYLTQNQTSLIDNDVS